MLRKTWTNDDESCCLVKSASLFITNRAVNWKLFPYQIGISQILSMEIEKNWESTNLEK